MDQTFSTTCYGVNMKSHYQFLIALSLGVAVLGGCSKKEEVAPAPAEPVAAPAPAAPAPEPAKEESGGWVPPPADVAPAPATADPAAAPAAPAADSAK
ncbi:hypothetical protein GALL_426290 [mine drainage metagenome]|uniref:Uncharacterized protein n=1 Tax=mine drainage metagenome TaxID=410659 RepID=A0A1J5Q760_9ZZZZ